MPVLEISREMSGKSQILKRFESGVGNLKSGVGNEILNAAVVHAHARDQVGNEWEMPWEMPWEVSRVR